MPRERNRPRKPWRAIAGTWRGGRVTAINGDQVTLRVRAEHATIAEYVVDASVFASGHAPTLNGAVAVRFAIAAVNDTTAIADRVVVEVRSAQFVGRIESTPEAENFGAIAYELTGESPFYDWEPGADPMPPRRILF
jgi:hypothetical protein